MRLSVTPLEAGVTVSRKHRARTTHTPLPTIGWFFQNHKRKCIRIDVDSHQRRHTELGARESLRLSPQRSGEPLVTVAEALEIARAHLVRVGARVGVRVRVRVRDRSSSRPPSRRLGALAQEVAAWLGLELGLGLANPNPN